MIIPATASDSLTGKAWEVDSSSDTSRSRQHLRPDWAMRCKIMLKSLHHIVCAQVSLQGPSMHLCASYACTLSIPDLQNVRPANPSGPPLPVAHRHCYGVFDILGHPGCLCYLPTHVHFGIYFVHILASWAPGAGKAALHVLCEHRFDVSNDGAHAIRQNWPVYRPSQDTPGDDNKLKAS